jgi:sugar phosphate isomerase/epimerase
MRNFTRRDFVRTGAVATAAAAIAWNGVGTATADPLGLPIGLQLYTVRDDMAKNFDGTLKAVAAAGYKEVEAAGFYNRSAAEFRKALDNVGLRCPSAHYPLKELLEGTGQKIAFAKELGLEYMVCSFPWVSDPSVLHPVPKTDLDWAVAIGEKMSFEGWKWNFQKFNTIGEMTKKAGIQFAYHNHNLEFKKFGDVLLYDEMLKDTDPALVSMEMDCGWVTAAGYDPVAYLEKFPKRYTMLHVKDIEKGFKPSTGLKAAESTEMGRGAIDYKRVFAAAKHASIKHYFVEQETYSTTPLEAIKIDYDYVHKLTV